MEIDRDFPQNKYALLKILIECCIRFGKSWRFYVLYNVTHGPTKELHLSMIRYFQGMTKALRKWRIEMIASPVVEKSEQHDTLDKE